MTVIDYDRLCGSLDIWLVADRDRWYVVEGIELTASHVSDVVSLADFARIREVDGIDIRVFEDESEAHAAFEARVEIG